MGDKFSAYECLWPVIYQLITVKFFPNYFHHNCLIKAKCTDNAQTLRNFPSVHRVGFPYRIYIFDLQIASSNPPALFLLLFGLIARMWLFCSSMADPPKLLPYKLFWWSNWVPLNSMRPEPNRCYLLWHETLGLHFNQISLNMLLCIHQARRQRCVSNG